MPHGETVLCCICEKVETPIAEIHGILICRVCRAALVLTPDGNTRIARSADVDRLTREEFQHLQQAR